MDVGFIPSEEDATRGQIEMTATGPWLETIMWEVPLMALLSEIYFNIVDTTWKQENQEGMIDDVDAFKLTNIFREGIL